MTTTELVERLQGFPTLAGVPREQLAWLATRGRLLHYERGAVAATQQQVVDQAYFLLSGHVVLFARQGTTRRKITEWHEGSFLGLLPYSRLVVSPGEGVAVEACEILALDREHFPQLIRDCYELTATMVHEMIDRARRFNTVGLHDEKMVSLGKLAAGLAHELNNPASAIARSARDLSGRLVEADEAARSLGTAGLSRDQIAAVDAVRDSCLITPVAEIRSPLEQADREDDIVHWLEKHGLDAALAEPLAETAITVEGLDRLAEALEGGTLDTALGWVANSCRTRGLAREIGEAASRINDLVGAVKGFTHMDRARIRQPVDIRQGLSNTLAMLEAKARQRKVSVKFEPAPGLPKVQGFGGELNQVWMNLIDNALDAVPEGGQVEVTVAVEGDRVVVTVVDNGAGIPEEILPHIFDPFFTTKAVGEGTGLGLDIARRLIVGHDGQIDVESRPGCTEFRVDVPIADPPAASATT